jgi:hypothetical protein
MGDSSLPGPADVGAFINAAEQHVSEVNGPYPIVDFLEADGMLLKRIGEKQEPRLQANRTGVGSRAVRLRLRDARRHRHPRAASPAVSEARRRLGGVRDGPARPRETPPVLRSRVTGTLG